MYPADRGAQWFFQQYYNLQGIPSRMTGESNPKNDTPLLLESRRGKLSAQVASQVPLCHKNGPDDGCCK